MPFLAPVVVREQPIVPEIGQNADCHTSPTAELAAVSDIVSKIKLFRRFTKPQQIAVVIADGELAHAPRFYFQRRTHLHTPLGKLFV